MKPRENNLLCPLSLLIAEDITVDVANVKDWKEGIGMNSTERH